MTGNFEIPYLSKNKQYTLSEARKKRLNASLYSFNGANHLPEKQLVLPHVHTLAMPATLIQQDGTPSGNKLMA